MAEIDLGDLGRRMDGALEALTREFGGLRTGRASASLLDPLTVDAYGSQMPLNQVGSVNAPEARLLTVQVWDQQLVKAVEKSIMESELGLNPQTEGNLIRIPIPDLSEERRTELKKVAGRYSEQAKIAVRNIRRDGMDTLKQMERDGEISKDEHKSQSEDIQKLTDSHISMIDEALASKEVEIMQV
jgi:ribosome recycling factor